MNELIFGRRVIGFDLLWGDWLFIGRLNPSLEKFVWQFRIHLLDKFSRKMTLEQPLLVFLKVVFQSFLHLRIGYECESGRREQGGGFPLSGISPG